MFKLGLRAKFLALTIGPILLLALTIILFIHTSLEKSLTNECQKRGEIIAYDVAKESINYLLAQDTYMLTTLAIDHVEDDEDIQFIYITDPDGNVLAHSFENYFPSAFRKLGLLTSHTSPLVQFFQSDKGQILHVIVPVLNGGAGVVHVGLNAEPIKHAVNETVSVIMTIIISISLMLCFVALIFVRIITNPVLKLTRIAELVGNGDFQHKALSRRCGQTEILVTLADQRAGLCPDAKVRCSHVHGLDGCK